MFESFRSIQDSLPELARLTLLSVRSSAQGDSLRKREPFISLGSSFTNIDSF